MAYSCDENGVVNGIIIHECPGCGKRYKTEKGLNAHLENCEDYIKSVAKITPSFEIKSTSIFEIEIEELKKEVEEIKNQLKVLNLWK